MEEIIIKPIAISSTKEYTKNYNKDYYGKNKERITELMKVREICKYCGKSIIHVKVIRHQKTKKCKATREQKESEKVCELQNKIKELEQKLLQQ